MDRNAKILFRYYDQIKANIELGLSPEEFANKCVSDYNALQLMEMKTRLEARRKKARLKEITSEMAAKRKLEKIQTAEGKQANEEKEINRIKQLKKGISKKRKIDKVKLEELKNIANEEYHQKTEESVLKSMKALSNMIDLMRGDDE
jgi:hypothetical protein